ncbi:MAG: 16S rRNA (cytosine(967)-C(5))-methyltransferase RsmB [Clostridia bacterium]|nr:16S rRNA (cytosine(967)-C(5))-methyltransferase RsmB [Clostridia bacterium]
MGDQRFDKPKPRTRENSVARRPYEWKPEGGKHETRQDGRRLVPGGAGRPGQNRGSEGERRPFGAPKDGPRFVRRPGGKPAAGAPKNMDARKLALSALCDVTIADAYGNIALDKRLREADLSPEDKRLATNIFYTALENRMYIDYLLAQFIEHMPEEQVVRELLHIAAAQILFMDRVPDYAAVDEAVNQIKAFNRAQYAPMVNGTLRNLIRARDAGELKTPDRATNPVRYLSIMHSLPETMVARLVDTYGEATAEEIVSFKPSEHWETVRPNLNELDDAAFEKLMDGRGWHFMPGTVPHSWHVIGAGDLPSDPDYRRGLFSIQSESSMLAAMAVGARPGMNIIDACAAPGGKTALMAEQMQGSGRVYAFELHEHRVELIKKTALRLRLYNIRPVATDATVLRPENEDAMDAVLLDAPCTGLGVMTSKPDLKYRLKDEKIESIVETQRKLLDTCCRYVKPGGTLVYSTCTLLKDENGDQIASFLERHPEFEPIADDSWLPDRLKPYFRNGTIQLLAHRDKGMEGFFIARLRRAR